MSTTQLSISEFTAHCPSILRDLPFHPQRIEVTDRGRVIAVVTPPAADQSPDPAAWLGSLRGSVLHDEASFIPTADPGEWNVRPS